MSKTHLHTDKKRTEPCYDDVYRGLNIQIYICGDEIKPFFFFFVSLKIDCYQLSVLDINCPCWQSLQAQYFSLFTLLLRNDSVFLWIYRYVDVRGTLGMSNPLLDLTHLPLFEQPHLAASGKCWHQHFGIFTVCASCMCDSCCASARVCSQALHYCIASRHFSQFYPPPFPKKSLLLK